MVSHELRKKYIDTLDCAQAFQVIVDDDTPVVLLNMLKSLQNHKYMNHERDVEGLIEKINAYIDDKLSKSSSFNKRDVQVFIRERHIENGVETSLNYLAERINAMSKKQDELNIELIDIKNRYVKPAEPIMSKLSGAPAQEFKMFTGLQTKGGYDTTAFKLVKYFNSIELNTEVDIDTVSSSIQRSKDTVAKSLKELEANGIIVARKYLGGKLYHAENSIKWT